MPGYARPPLWLLVLVALLALAAPWVVYPVFLMKLLCWALLAASLNLLVGQLGLLSFGHAMFFGSAAYVTAQAVKVWALDPALGLLLGAGAAALLGLAGGLLAVRRHGTAFSMITLAIAQLVYFVALRAPFTGGENGLQNVPRGRLLGWLPLHDDMTLYYFVLLVVVAGFWLIYRTVNSPFGHVLAAIRDSEPRAVSLGYRVNRYKLAAYVLSAAFAGLAGGLKALVFQIATLADVHWATSGDALLMVIVGGVQTLAGPLVGALVVVSMQEYFASFAEVVLMLQGLVFIVVVLAFRRGLVGEWQAWRERHTARAAQPEASS
ncbi:MAG: branched-chain amino acid ABC transporter permease [Burkholderiales bacterium]|nr:branched-chain amino acid ABC transporter permease [Burkholderiales bacterium]MDE2394023.1 branched-chain amino acid ABC transporter permease [Burkholderiales bacterium]MDE2456776.1 branched-chain amino acid ABC transporter permease [Burkholderiales bacterium]